MTREQRWVCAAMRVPPWVIGLTPRPRRAGRFLWEVYCRLPRRVRTWLP